MKCDEGRKKKGLERGIYELSLLEY